MSDGIVLVYIHIGKTLIDYLIDSVYQSLIINHVKGICICIYVLLSDSLVDEFNQSLLKLKDINEGISNIKIIKLSLLEPTLSRCEDYLGYINIIKSKNLTEFRDSFWISTTCRFFYLKEFVKLYLKDSKNIFHIENDVMLYKPLQDLMEIVYVPKNVYMVKDSSKRVIPSIMCFCDSESLELINQHIFKTLKESKIFMNDMEILSKFPNLIKLRHNPYINDKIPYVYDGAALGQYIGGVDYRNIPNTPITQLNNPTIGFINETCDFKLNEDIEKKYENNLKRYLINQNEIVNLHIHSKQLFKFSSVFDIDYNDIITGDRVFNLVDYVVTTQQIYNFHNLKESDIKPVKMVLVDSVKTLTLLNSQTILKLFVYSHILDYFIECLNDCTIEYEVVIYTHNSDHEFTEEHYEKLSKIFKKLKVFAQNVNCELHDNVNLLPIGLANSMWKHGSLLTLYNTMKQTYTHKKTKGIFINANPKTYNYRYDILKQINPKHLCRSSEFSDYLKTLSEYKYSLCIRGNGIDTHRFWESLYLGVIPVIINDCNTKCENFVKYIRKLGVPFKEINDFSKFDITEYDIQCLELHVQCLEQLKIGTYY